MVAEAVTQVLRGDLLDPLSLVANEDVKSREDFSKTAFFNHQVGKQEVMICDDDSGSGRFSAEGIEEAVFPVKTS